MIRKSANRFSVGREDEARRPSSGGMMRKLVIAALVALVAAPAVTLWQAGCGLQAPRLGLDLGAARSVSIGALVSTGLI